jgi:hypothetical protein
MSSSQQQKILNPPVHFSNFNSHRGNTHQFVAGVGAVAVGCQFADPADIIPVRSIIIVDITTTPFGQSTLAVRVEESR